MVQRAESLPETAPSSVRAMGERTGFGSEGHAREERIERIELCVLDLDCANRRIARTGSNGFDPARLARLAEKPVVVDLREVVILGGEPEHGHGRSASASQFLGATHRRERLVERECGTAEQSHLLARSDDDGLGRGQPIEVFERGRAAVTVLPVQFVDQRLPALRVEPNVPRRFAGRLQRRRVRIEPAHARKVTQQVCVERPRPRQVGLTKRGGVHRRSDVASRVDLPNLLDAIPPHAVHPVVQVDVRVAMRND